MGMFRPGEARFTKGPRSVELEAIERRIVALLAESLGRDAAALKRELRSAHRDLPVEERALKPILGTLEAEFEVSLRPAGAASLNYVRELAIFILDARARTLPSSAPSARASATGRVQDERDEAPTRPSGARLRGPRRAREPRARRSA